MADAQPEGIEMTVIVMGHIRAPASEIDRLKPAIDAMVAATTQEEGCEHYSFARHVGDPELLILSERWASAEALAAHGQTAHMKAFNQAIAGATLHAVSVKVWNGSFWRTLIGE